MIGAILECMESLGECYQELKKVKKMYLEHMYAAGMQNGSDKEDASKMVNSQQYKDAMAAKGSIVGLNIGILIALFSVIAYFGI